MFDRARIQERLADGDVIVVEVIREPLVARGLLGVFDISLCDEVVVGAHNLWEARSRPGCQGPQAEVRRVFYPRHHGS